MGSPYMLVSDSNEKNLADIEHYIVSQPETQEKHTTQECRYIPTVIEGNIFLTCQGSISLQKSHVKSLFA